MTTPTSSLHGVQRARVGRRTATLGALALWLVGGRASAGEEDTRVRIGKLLQLGRSRAPGAREELEVALMDPAEAVRVAAAAGLQALADPESLPALERRLAVERAAPVRARLEAALDAVRLATLRAAKFTVQVGHMTSATPEPALVAVMQRVARARAGRLRGAIVLDGPSDPLHAKAVERRLPMLVVDGRLSRLAHTPSSEGVTVEASVDFVIRSGETLRGSFRGGASGNAPASAAAARLHEVREKVVAGAVESALRGAEASFHSAAR